MRRCRNIRPTAMKSGISSGKARFCARRASSFGLSKRGQFCWAADGNSGSPTARLDCWPTKRQQPRQEIPEEAASPKLPSPKLCRLLPRRLEFPHKEAP